MAKADGRSCDRGVTRFLFRFREGHRRWFVLTLVMLVVEAVASVFKAYPIGYLVDYLKGNRPDLWFPWIASPQIRTTALLTSAIIGLAALDSLGDSLAEIFLARGGRRLGYNMRVTLYSHLQSLSLAFHHRRRTGDMLRRVTGDVEQVEQFIVKSLSDIAGSILLLIGTLTFLVFHSWQVAVLALVMVPVLSLVSNYFSQRITATARRQRAREGDLASAAQEMLPSVPVVQTFGQSRYEQERFEEDSHKAMAAALDSVGLEARFSWVVGVLEAVSISAVVWVGIWLVARHAFSVGTLVLFIMLIQNMFRPTRKLIKQWTMIGKVRASVERVAEVFARRPSVHDLPAAKEAPSFRGALEFRHVSFAYRPDPEDRSSEAPHDSPSGPVLDDVSFRVRPGEVVALVGPSGAGKSTIAQLVPRLYDPDAGEVRIDGSDIRSFTLDSLRRQVSLVLQDTILFRGTVAHNIGYGRAGATRDEIVAAAVRANAHEFIERMPDGYDTELSERATNLSGGQRQRIAIARALVRNAPILILDEPTTGLDAVSSRVVVQALRRLMKGKTTIIISHDLGLIRAADRIMVIRQGRIEQTGRHEELLREGGLYASLYSTRLGEPGRQNATSGSAATAPIVADRDLCRSPALRAELPGLEDAFDERVMRGYLHATLFEDGRRVVIERCERAQAMYAPGEGCVVRYRIEARDRSSGSVAPALAIAHLFADPRSARSYLQSRLAPLAGAMRGRPEVAPFATPVAMLEPLSMTVSLFPIDGELPTLVGVTDPAAMLDILCNTLPDARAGRFTPTRCHVELGHYGRQHRCVLRYTVHGTRRAGEEAAPITVYGKVAADHRGALTAAVVPELRERILRGQDPAFTVPQSFGFIEPLQLTLLEAIPGRPWISALLKDGAGSGPGSNGAPTLARSIDTAARIAAVLHSSGIALGPSRGFDDELAELGHALAAMQRVSSGLAAEFDGWLEALHARAASDPGEPGLSHGDFTHSQLIFSGERCGLVDFDTVCRAEPALDLGQFLAYLRMGTRKAGVSASADGREATERLCRRFLDTYMIECGHGPGERDALRARVHLYEVVSLLRLAFHSWQKFKAARLELAMDLIRERLPSVGRSSQLRLAPQEASSTRGRKGR